MLPDLDSPFDDFKLRVNHLRATLVIIESGGRKGVAGDPRYPHVDLSIVGPTTLNNVTAMSIVFLASSFEEFFREEISLCAAYLQERFFYLGDQEKLEVRNLYWSVCLDRLRSSRTLLNGAHPKAVNAEVLTAARALLDSASRFSLEADASGLNNKLFPHHSQNFRPHVVDEIACRICLKNFLDKVAVRPSVKAFFGTDKKRDTLLNLHAYLKEFYDVRNQIVHSLNQSAGYAVNIVFAYFDFFLIYAQETREVLNEHISSW